jgi:hypothetical protein
LDPEEMEDETSAEVCAAIVLRYVVALEQVGECPTIPALVQTVIDGTGRFGEGNQLETAIRDLVGDGKLACLGGGVVLTPAARESHRCRQPEPIKGQGPWEPSSGIAQAKADVSVPCGQDLALSD